MDTIDEHLDFAHSDRGVRVQVGSPQAGVARVVQVDNDVEVLPRGDRDGFRQLQNSCLLRATIYHGGSSAIETEDTATAGEVPAGALKLRLVADCQSDVHLVRGQLVLEQSTVALEPEPHAQRQHDVRVVGCECRRDGHVGPVGQTEVGTVEQTSLLLHGGGGRGVRISANQGIPIHMLC